jgi:hypothetical protein
MGIPNNSKGEIMKINQARQGDVWVERITKTNAIPKDAKPLALQGKRIILAAGEVTGHHHAIAIDERTICEAYEKDGKIYLHVEAPKDLVHEEHGHITLPAGYYESWIQREWDVFESRRAQD